MIPAAIRSPARTGLTPWRMTTRCTPRAPRAGWTQPALRGILADGSEAQADINWLYQVTLGRPADPAGLATQQAALAAGQNQAQIRVALAQSPEEAADVASLFANLLGRAPSADETAGVQAAVGAGYPGDAAFTLTGVVNGAAQTFATADAATDLSELSVYVTLNSGVTPTLVDMNGGSRTFANATQLAGYLLGQAIQSGNATPVLLSTYDLTVAWLAQTDQPMLQAGEAELNAARAAQAGGNAGLAQADEVTAQVEFDAAALPAQRGGWALTQATAWAQAAENAVAGGNLVYATFDETATRMYLAFATTPAPDAGQTRLLTAAQQFIAEGQAGGAAGDVNRVNLCAAGADLCEQSALGSSNGFGDGIAGLTFSLNNDLMTINVHGCGQNATVAWAQINAFAGRNFAFGGVASNLYSLVGGIGPITHH